MKILALLALPFLLIPSLLIAHSGGTDSKGCHTNRQTGEYHCHNKTPSASQGSTQAHYKESVYQKAWCIRHGGQIEVVLPDKTRADCITEAHAIEFDFGRKWAEAIGQALYYSIQTGKQPGIVLILEKESDYKYWIRLNTVIDHFALKVKTWQMKPEDL